MFRFRPEWQEAPGVKDKVLARTWARLEIRAEDHVPERYWPSNVISSAESVQRGIYGSVFPLAEWVVENWWFLLHEPCRVPELPNGRSLAKDPYQRQWVQRHNLLAAREGGSLPDLYFYRDGAAVVAHWFPDPELEDAVRPVRFFTSGKSRISLQDAEASLQRLIEEVLTRLDAATDEDTRRLQNNWNALCDSRQNERDLCASAAQLGLDPYDPSELTDDLAAVVESQVSKLGEELRTDLLQASTASSLASDLDWVNHALGKGELAATHASMSAPFRNGHRSAHALGYQLAEQFRNQIGLRAQPVDNLAQLLQAKCGWPQEPEIHLDSEAANRLAALVGKDRYGLPHVVGPRVNLDAERFRLARAVYFLPSASDDSPPRLLTKAYAWDQRASRAFAAELLAPAEALRAEVHDGVPHAKVEELAKKFQVSAWVIEHQLQNHRIGWMEEF